MNNFAEEAKSYVNTNPLEARPDVEVSGGVRNRLKQYYLNGSDRNTWSLEEYRLLLENGEIDIKEGREYLKELKKILKEKNLSERGREIAQDYINLASTKNNNMYGDIGMKTPFKLRAKAFVGGTVPLYFAMVMRDVFHTATGGWGVSDAMSGDYKEYRKAILEGDTEKAAEGTKRTFGHYFQWETHVSLGAFITTSHLVGGALESSKVMERIYKFADRRLYSFGGRTLIRGISGFGLAMGAGMKVSQIVGTGLIMRKELFNSNEQIKELAWDIFNQQNFSAESFQQLFNIILSFGLADVIWDGRTLPAFYDKLKNLNKKKCAYTYKEILDRARGKQNQVIGRANKKWYNPKELARISAIFVTADLLENFIISKMFFPNAEHMMEEKLMKYYQLLMGAEVNAFIDDLLQSEIEEIDNVLDRYEGLMLMEYIIGKLRPDKDIFVKCLKLRDAGKTEEARNCLNIFVNSMSWKSNQFIEYYNSVCAPEDRIKYDAAMMNEAFNELETDEYKDAVLQHMQDVYNNIEPSTDATSELMKVVTPEIMTDVYIHQEKMMFSENSLMDNSRNGNVKEAVASAEVLFELYGMPNFYPLFQQVITDAWDIKLTGPYGFDLDKGMSKGEDKLSSPKASLYLKKLLYLFSVSYPKMINTPVYERGIEMTQYQMREDLLTMLAEGLFNNLKQYAKGDDLKKAEYALNIARVVMLLSETKEATANVLYSMDKTFTNIGINKIYVEVPFLISTQNDYQGLDFDIDEFYEYGEQDSNQYPVNDDAKWDFIDPSSEEILEDFDLKDTKEGSPQDDNATKNNAESFEQGPEDGLGKDLKNTVDSQNDVGKDKKKKDKTKTKTSKASSKIKRESKEIRLFLIKPCKLYFAYVIRVCHKLHRGEQGT
jgi:hypothetical protein